MQASKEMEELCIPSSAALSKRRTYNLRRSGLTDKKREPGRTKRSVNSKRAVSRIQALSHIHLNAHPVEKKRESDFQPYGHNGTMG